jgi:GH25 family lysozyme M1 (1,4-beta-N-acetylmuramidase)
MTDFGIDVSHHNQVDDWNAVRGNNISYVSVKVTESTDFTDKAAGGHAAGARAVGIRVLLWIARYNGNPGQPGWSHQQLALHQHSNRGNVPGIPAHVDRDATVGSHTLANVLIG